LHEKIADIINDAEKVVARYTLPFLNSNIADSSHVENIETTEIDADSYMRSVNALLRIHSVIGQILGARPGTYNSILLLDCITKMVMASGRYASLNHSIAAVLIFDKEKSLQDLKRGDHENRLTLEERYDKVVRIFSFWSVYLSHAGLARYLSKEHAIRALQKLAATHEAETNKTLEGNIPFNFSIVLLIAKLYHDGENRQT
jgi:hypothetical protein